MQFITGFKLIALASFVFGSVLVAICGLSLDQFLKARIAEGNSSLLHGGNKSTANGGDEQAPTSKEDIINTEYIKMKWSELTMKWSKFKPFLLGSSGVGLICGLVQVLSAIFIMCSGANDIRGRSKCWQCTHFIICGLLIACVLVPTIFSMRNDSLNHLQELLEKIGASFKSKKNFDSFQISLVEIYTGFIAVDICVIVILAILTCCLMRNADYDYKAP